VCNYNSKSSPEPNDQNVVQSGWFPEGFFLVS
jgi:hypothetical protein